MRNNLNQSRFQGIARAMTRNYGVNVIFGGTCPKTDGRTIYLPANADELPGHAQDSLEGWLDHENCHVEEEIKAKENGTTSPMALMGGPARARGAAAQLLLNVYEDIRIEDAKAATHPGVAENLRTVNERSIKRYLKGTTGDVWQDIAGAIIATGRGLDTSWIKGGTKVIIDLIQDELSETGSMTSPDDAFDLAVRTLDKIESLVPEAQDEQDKREEGEGEGEDGEGEDGEGEDSDDTEGADEPDEDSEGEDGEGGAQGEDETAEDDTESAEGNGDGDEDGETDEGDSDGEVDAKQNGEGEDTEDGEDQADDTDDGDGDGEGKARSVEDLTDDELEDLQEALAEADGTEPANTDFVNYSKEDISIKAVEDASANNRCIAPVEIAKGDGFVPVPEVSDDGIKDYQKAKADVNDQIGTLKRKLNTVLRARQQVHFVGDKDDGQLDQAALYTIKTGERRVFAQRTTAIKINTTVQLLIDLSGSMGHGGDKLIKCGKPAKRKNRAWYAKRTAVAFAETLDSIGVPFEVLGFHSDFQRHTRDNLPAGCNRWGSFHITPFKLFNERLRQVRGRFKAITGRGCNGDGDAVMFAAKRLAQRPEDRKLLIVISDGQPSGPADNDVLQADLKRVITEVTNSGIEVYGIGANNHAVSEYYNERHGASYIVINDLSKLATSVFKLIRSKLLKRAAA